MKYLKEATYSLLQSFEFEGLGDFMHSLMPTLKYNLVFVVFGLSIFLTWIDRLFGVDAIAVAALFLIMVLEIASGTYASKIKKEDFTSRRLSRFTFKIACYLVLILVPNVFFESFKARGSTVAAGIFEWLHVFLVVQIVIENVLSILENIAVIQGKSKSFWIDKIKSKINSSL